MDITYFKSVIGIIAVILTFSGYIPYIRDILNGKTKPHMYSWFLWMFVGSLAFSLQFSDGGGAGSFVTLAATIMCAVVFLLSFFRKSSNDITKSDTLFFGLTIAAVVVWLFAKQPLFSMVLTTGIDLLCFVPTIRKSWHKPETETASFYLINSFRFFLAAVALQRYTIITALYPVVWMVANGLFVVMLELRKKYQVELRKQSVRLR